MTGERASPPIIYVTIDSLRWDAVDVYDTDRGDTPRLASLAADGTVFETAITNAPNTDQSFRAALTSLYPNEPVPMERRPYLPALLSDAGYHTVAFYDTPKLAGKGFDRGFDRHPEHDDEGPEDAGAEQGELLSTRLKSSVRGALSIASHRSEHAYELLKTVQFRSSPPYERAARLNRRATQFLDERSSDELFLWIHYMDTHYPYLPTEETRRSRGVELSDWRVANSNVEIQKFISSDFAADVDDEALERLRTLYRCQVKYVDSALGSLIDMLCTHGLYKEALIIVASDHGEEFLEHGHLGHSQHLYDELIRVPFVVKPPAGVGPAARVDGLVEYLDIPPTVLDFAGLGRPDVLRGTSLRDAITTGTADTDAVISEWGHDGERIASIRTGTEKYIRDGIRDREELYDLEADPGERDNLVDGSSAVDDLRDALVERLPAFDSHGPDRDDVTGQRTRQLEDLGYL